MAYVFCLYVFNRHIDPKPCAAFSRFNTCLWRMVESGSGGRGGPGGCGVVQSAGLMARTNLQSWTSPWLNLILSCHSSTWRGWEGSSTVPFSLPLKRPQVLSRSIPTTGLAFLTSWTFGLHHSLPNAPQQRRRHLPTTDGLDIRSAHKKMACSVVFARGHDCCLASPVYCLVALLGTSPPSGSRGWWAPPLRSATLQSSGPGL